jgi:hypothetical protein
MPACDRGRRPSSGAAPSPRNAPCVPPPEYFRRIILGVQDVNGAPLPGVTATIDSELGTLLGESTRVSGPDGLIALEFQPVMEDPMAGLKVRDRYLLYHTRFRYTLAMPGRVSISDEVRDEQDFASLRDPLYQGMERQPSAAPRMIYVKMAAYADYLADPEAMAGQGWKGWDRDRLRALIDSAIQAGRDNRFALSPGSIRLDPNRPYAFHMEFRPLFDPARHGLQAAGGILLRDPVRAMLRVFAAA